MTDWRALALAQPMDAAVTDDVLPGTPGEFPEAAADPPAAVPDHHPLSLVRRSAVLLLSIGLLLGGLAWYRRPPAEADAGYSARFAPQQIELVDDGSALQAAATGAPEAQRSAVEPTAGSESVVYVSGAVVAPDVYRLPDGARLIDALAAAGGPTDQADLTALNLARRIADAEHIAIPRRGAPQPTAAQVSEQPGAPAAPAAQPIALNRATAAELQQLPGIGPALAERIIAHREANGPYVDLAALNEVSGIGDRIISEIGARISFTP